MSSVMVVLVYTSPDEAFLDALTVSADSLDSWRTLSKTERKLLKKRLTKEQSSSYCSVRTDSAVFCALYRELQCCHQRPLEQLLKTVCHQNNFSHFPLLVVFQLHNPPYYPIYLDWCKQTEALLRKRLELDSFLYHLSTLGGAFSAMGDYQTSFAKAAGKVSMAQMKIALSIGDPILVSRCKLFIALSMIQQGYLRHAKKITKEQYCYGKKINDTQLCNAAIGVWSKLRYTYTVRRKHTLKDHC